jgi:hypothetical protein
MELGLNHMRCGNAGSNAATIMRHAMDTIVGGVGCKQFNKRVFKSKEIKIYHSVSVPNLKKYM